MKQFAQSFTDISNFWNDLHAEDEFCFCKYIVHVQIYHDIAKKSQKFCINNMYLTQTKMKAFSAWFDKAVGTCLTEYTQT